MQLLAVQITTSIIGEIMPLATMVCDAHETFCLKGITVGTSRSQRVGMFMLGAVYDHDDKHLD